MSNASRNLIFFATCPLLWPCPAPAAGIVGRGLSPDSSFVPNCGQSSNEVLFSRMDKGHVIALTRQGAVLRFANKVVTMVLPGTNPNPRVDGLDLQPGLTSYLIGLNKANWCTDSPTYGRVRYRNIFPGIDLIYYGNQRQLEYDLIVAPHADPKPITMQFDSSGRLRLSPEGDLILSTDLRLLKPRAYQQTNGARKDIPTHYILKSRNRVAFALAPYDHTLL